MKRENYISWDEFFMGVAELASKRSKDPNTQNGVCIVNPVKNNILSVGYNGLPRGLQDDGYFDLNIDNTNGSISGYYDYWEKPQKYDYSVHAEENALFNATTNLNGSIMYLFSERGYPPCSRCARGIVQNGLTEIILNTLIKDNTDKYNWEPTFHMFDMANINIKVLNK